MVSPLIEEYSSMALLELITLYGKEEHFVRFPCMNHLDVTFSSSWEKFTQVGLNPRPEIGDD
jgi:hypothetical protein